MQRTLQRKNPQTKMVASVRSMKGNKEPKNSHTVSKAWSFHILKVLGPHVKLQKYSHQKLSKDDYNR